MADYPLLSERREWTGQWWVPGDEESRYGGILEFDPGSGALLRMAGGFEYQVFQELAPGVTSYGGETRNWPVIHGVAEGREFTLLRCSVAHARTFNMVEPSELHLRVHAILVGTLLDDPDSATFVGASAAVENLPTWASESAFTVRIGLKEEDGHKRFDGTSELKARGVEKREVKVGDQTFALQHTYTVPRVETTRSAFAGKARDQPWLSVEFGAPVTIDDATEPLVALRDLLSLATSDSCGLVWTRLQLPPVPGMYPDDHPYAGKPRDIDLYRAQQVLARPGEKAPDWPDILFTLNDLAFADVVPKWFETRARFQAAANMILGLRYNREIYLESRVTTVVGAAESMHRALDTPPQIPDEEFSALRKLLLKCAPKEHRNWLGSLLLRNEPTLKSRLLDLVGRLDPVIAASLIPDPKRWAERAKDARNDLAHTGQASKHSIDELFAVTVVTEAVVVLNLLQAVGVPADRLATKLTDNRRLRRARVLAHKHFGIAV